MKTSDVANEYRYTPKWHSLLFGLIVTGGMSAFMLHLATTNQRGVIINGVLELGPEGATRLFYALGALMALCACAGVGLLFVRLFVKQRIALTQTELLMPRNRYTSDERRIAFRDVQNMTLREVYGQRMLELKHPDGKAVLLLNWLPTADDAEHVLGEIADRVTKAQQGKAG